MCYVWRKIIPVDSADVLHVVYMEESSTCGGQFSPPAAKITSLINRHAPDLKNGSKSTSEKTPGHFEYSFAVSEACKPFVADPATFVATLSLY